MAAAVGERMAHNSRERHQGDFQLRRRRSGGGPGKPEEHIIITPRGDKGPLFLLTAGAVSSRNGAGSRDALQRPHRAKPRDGAVGGELQIHGTGLWCPGGAGSHWGRTALRKRPSLGRRAPCYLVLMAARACSQRGASQEASRLQLASTALQPRGSH